MDAGQLEVFGQVAGIGGLAIAILAIVFRDVIRRSSSEGTFRLLAVLSFVVAIAGIASWTWSAQRSPATIEADRDIRVDEAVIERAQTDEPRTEMRAGQDIEAGTLRIRSGGTDRAEEAQDGGDASQ